MKSKSCFALGRQQRCRIPLALAVAMALLNGFLHGEEPAGPVAGVEVQYATREAHEHGVTLARLTNGMTVLVQENHAAPVATVRCFVKNTGSAYEGKDLGAGLSHVLEHVVAGGSTSKRTEAQIREILDSLGGHTNAYTSDDVTAFYIDCPGSSVGVAIELLAQNMQFSLIPQNEYAREMGVVQRELEMGEADRGRMQYNTIKQLIYLTHPKRHPTIGYLPVVRQITRDDVFSFYKSRYVPQNMMFVVVGDVETDGVLDDVLAAFKDFQRTPERDVVLPEEPEQAAPRWTRLEMEGEATEQCLAWPTVALQHPDLYPLDVLAYVLTNGDSSRLVHKLRIEQPLALSIGSASYTPGSVRGWLQVAAQCKPQDADVVRRTILDEIERLKTELISEKELAKAKRQKAADHVFGQQSVDSQADMLAESHRWTGDPLFDAHYVAAIQEVTAEQIRDVVRKYVRPERLNSVVIAPLGSGAATAARDHSRDESPIIKKQLSNGLTLMLKRETNLPLVSLQAYVRAGALSDTAETSGLASLTTELLERGTRKYSAAEIAQYFDSIGGKVSLSSQINFSFLQASVLKDDAEQALDYVGQMLAAPTFPADEFAKVLQIRMGRIAARKANPQAEIFDFWAQQLPASSPYSRTALGRAETVGRLTRDDCAKFHKTYFVPNNMVVAIFGDIDTDRMQELAQSALGTLPRASDFRWPTFPAAQTPLAEESAKHLQNQKKNTGMVLLSYPTVSIANEKSRSTLDLLDALITGGGGAGGRLHEELRGEQLVYYVHGRQYTGFAPGYFLILAQTRPESMGEVVQRIRANLDKIRREGVPEDEFEKARRKLIVSHRMQNTTVSERAFQASIDELYGLGYEYDKSYAERLNRIRPDDVKEVVAKYFAHGLLVTSSPDAAPPESLAEKPTPPRGKK